MRLAPATPLNARKIKKEYWSGRKEMTRLSDASIARPQTKTALGETRSTTRPQNRRTDANAVE